MSTTLFGLASDTVVGLVGTIVLAVLVVWHLRNRQLTKFHVPAVVLLLLGVTAAFGTVLAFEAADRHVAGTEYAVEAERPPADAFPLGQETPPAAQENGTEPLRQGKVMSGPHKFEELSPRAQDMFLSALRGEDSYLEKYMPRVSMSSELQRGDTYTTRSPPPPEFQPGYYQSDVGGPPHTYVQYDSVWYVIYIVNDGGWSGFAYYFVLIGGGIPTGILLVSGLASLTSPSFKGPVSILTGGFTTALLPTTGGLFSKAMSFIVITLVTWIILRLLETQLQQSFREQMTTTDDR